MSKKYVPNGYQIISIDASGQTSGVGFTPETEDEKLLYQILTSGEIKKPILLHIIDMGDQVWCGFPTIIDGFLSLTSGTIGESQQLNISVDSTTLVVEMSAE